MITVVMYYGPTLNTNKKLGGEEYPTIKRCLHIKHIVIKYAISFTVTFPGTPRNHKDYRKKSHIGLSGNKLLMFVQRSLMTPSSGYLRKLYLSAGFAKLFYCWEFGKGTLIEQLTHCVIFKFFKCLRI